MTPRSRKFRVQHPRPRLRRRRVCQQLRLTQEVPMTLPPSEAPQAVKNARVAAVQMVSTPRVEVNLIVAATLIAEAVAQRADLVALPEYFPIMGLRDGDKISVREADGTGPIQDFLAETARQ